MSDQDITKAWLGDMIDDLYERAFETGKKVGQMDVIGYLSQHKSDYGKDGLGMNDIDDLREVFKV